LWDTDGDGVPDGWIDGWTYDSSKNPSYGIYNVPDGQFQFGEGEDKNLDGTADSTETKPSGTNSFDSDVDGLLDGWDISSSDLTPTQINAFNAANIMKSGNGPYLYWGELSYSAHFLDGGNGNPQNGPTDPTNPDSDGDGLTDGPCFGSNQLCELSRTHSITQILNGIVYHNQIIQSRYTDPSLMDSDGDQLSDGIEISGWEVHIISERTKLEVRSRVIFADPTTQHSDNDGVSDYNEFLNCADPTSTDTDGDLILDNNEGRGELTQIEGKDPEIIKLDDAGDRFFLNIQKVCDDSNNPLNCHAAIKVTATVKDNAGLGWVSIHLSGQQKQVQYFSNAPLQQDVAMTFDCDWSKVIFSGWDVNITVADVNGNGNYTQTHVNSITEGIIKAIIDSWNSFIKEVKELASAALEWLYNAIKVLFKPIVDKIQDILRPFVDKLFDIILNNFSILFDIKSGRLDIGGIAQVSLAESLVV
jgi:hypothetical protein